MATLAGVRRLVSRIPSSLLKPRLASVHSFSTSAAGGFRSSRGKVVLATAALAAGVTLGVSEWRHVTKTNVHVVRAACSQKREGSVEAGRVRPELPNYSLDEVSKHKEKETRIWVTYGDGVYDITDFIEQHPGGGDKIILAAGSSLEPFWAVFAAHNTDEVRHILEEWRIGNITPGDRGKTQAESHKEGPYANDPERTPILKINMKEPFNAETPTVLLDNEFTTPNNLFFVRNHLPVPQVDPDKFMLEVQVTDGEPPVRFTLNDLKTKFKHYTVTATIQCAGNRRLELAKIKPVKGLSWTGGAIGNATWTGVRLRDVLLHAGVKDGEEYDVRHVHLEGLDNNHLTGDRYGASIPIKKAMDIRGDCILAFEMNGEEIPRDHGYPLRAVVPGTVGARNVKWLTRVVASEKEYGGFWQQRDYKGFSPCIDWNNVDFSTAPAIQELPIQSLICTPQEGTSVDAEELHVTGVAWSGGGRGVVRVDVSANGGKSWQVANLGSGKEQKGGRAWAWTLWEATVPLPSKGDTELVCKAVDTSYNVQPDSPGPIWNLRGCLSNAWHRVNVHVK